MRDGSSFASGSMTIRTLRHSGSKTLYDLYGV
jgi:hypothetical protein